MILSIWSLSKIIIGKLYSRSNEQTKIISITLEHEKNHQNIKNALGRILTVGPEWLFSMLQFQMKSLNLFNCTCITVPSNEQWVSSTQRSLFSVVGKPAINQRGIRGQLNPQGSGHPSSHEPCMKSNIKWGWQARTPNKATGTESCLSQGVIFTWIPLELCTAVFLLEGIYQCCQPW